MRFLYKVFTVISISLLLGAVIAVFPRVTYAQQASNSCVQKTIIFASAGPYSAVEGQTVVPFVKIRAHCQWSNGPDTEDNGQGAVAEWKYAGITSTSTVGADGIARGPPMKVTYEDLSTHHVYVTVTDNTNAPTIGAGSHAWDIKVAAPPKTPAPAPNQGKIQSLYKEVMNFDAAKATLLAK